MTSFPTMHEITSNPDIMGGTAVFAGTRVPFEALIEYLQAGETIDDFILDFPSVEREHASRALLEASLTAEKFVCENPA